MVTDVALPPFDPLPPFDIFSPVVAHHGREDCVQLNFGTWVVQLPPNAGKAHEALREIRYALLQPHGELFSQGKAFTTTEPLMVRGSKSKSHSGSEDDSKGKPLFSGNLKTKMLNPGQILTSYGQQWVRACTFRFESLIINPLRFIRYQSLPDDDTPSFWGKSRLFKPEEQPDTEGEYSLDNNDNWIPVNASWNRFARPSNWTMHLRRYIAAVRNTFEHELEKAICSSLDPKYHNYLRHEEYTLQQVEHVWEFFDAEPRETVDKVHTALMHLGRRKAKNTLFKVGTSFPEEAGEYNSRSVNISLSANVTVKVYAKTNRRIRVEVKHKNLKREQLLRLGTEQCTDMTTNKKHMQMIDLLDWLKESSAKAANNVLSGLRKAPDTGISQRSIYGFFADFADACTGPGELREVVSMLLTNGMIRSGINGAPTPHRLKTVVRRLKLAELVVNDGNAGHRVAPRYEWALKQLRSIDAQVSENLFFARPPIRDRN